MSPKLLNSSLSTSTLPWVISQLQGPDTWELHHSCTAAAWPTAAAFGPWNIRQGYSLGESLGGRKCWACCSVVPAAFGWSLSPQPPAAPQLCCVGTVAAFLGEAASTPSFPDAPVSPQASPSAAWVTTCLCCTCTVRTTSRRYQGLIPPSFQPLWRKGERDREYIQLGGGVTKWQGCDFVPGISLCSQLGLSSACWRPLSLAPVP